VGRRQQLPQQPRASLDTPAPPKSQILCPPTTPPATAMGPTSPPSSPALAIGPVMYAVDLPPSQLGATPVIIAGGKETQPLLSCRPGPGLCTGPLVPPALYFTIYSLKLLD
jgi:hypothetical protein